MELDDSIVKMLFAAGIIVGAALIIYGLLFSVTSQAQSAFSQASAVTSGTPNDAAAGLPSGVALPMDGGPGGDAGGMPPN